MPMEKEKHLCRFSVKAFRHAILPNGKMRHIAEGDVGPGKGWCKGQVFLVDSNIAVILAVVLLALFIQAFGAYMNSLSDQTRHEGLVLKCMSIADHMVKGELAHEERGVRFHHIIEESKIERLKIDAYAGALGVGGMSVELSNSASEGFGSEKETGAERACVSRGVVVYETGEPVLLNVCVWG